ncbi:MAG: Hpt domain-containing protein [Chitinophagaceae bacterium]
MIPENIQLYNLTNLKDQTGNDEIFLQQMVILFIKQTDENLKKIAIAKPQKSWAEIHFIVHKIKSAINLFGIKNLQQIIVETEEMTRETNHEKKILENLQLIEKVLKQCMAQLKIAFNVE